jgi:hypothetical protein
VTATRLGYILIIIGVLVWVVYAGAKFGGGYDGPVTPFLLVHLLFVVPGAFLAGRGWTRRLIEMFSGGPRDDVRNG